MEYDGLTVLTAAELLDEDFNDPALVAEAQRRFDVGTVIEQFGTWAVTDYGVECLTQYYPIQKDRLYEDEPDYGWMFHMSGKRWVKMEDFGDCLLAARAYHDPDRKTWPRQPTKKKARSLAPKLRFAVLRRDGYRCRLCGANGAEVKLQVDHIHPVSAGGKTHEANLQTLCFECNIGKGVQPL